MVVDLKDFFVKMVTPPSGITGIQLLNSSISMWATNVLIFSVVHWRLDRGGSEARAEGTPDWHLPPGNMRRMGPNGGQLKPDYLFLAFCTAAAFTPAEAMPMTSPAQLMLMAECLISLVTVMAIVSRAMGLLGSYDLGLDHGSLALICEIASASSMLAAPGWSSAEYILASGDQDPG